MGAVLASFVPNGNWPVSGAFAGLGQASELHDLRLHQRHGSWPVASSTTTATSTAPARTSRWTSTATCWSRSDFDNSSFTPGCYGYLREHRRASDQVVFSNGNIAVDNFTFGVTAGNNVPEPGTAGLVQAYNWSLLSFDTPPQRLKPRADDGRLQLLGGHGPLHGGPLQHALQVRPDVRVARAPASLVLKAAGPAAHHEAPEDVGGAEARRPAARVGHERSELRRRVAAGSPPISRLRMRAFTCAAPCRVAVLDQAFRVEVVHQRAPAACW